MTLEEDGWTIDPNGWREHRFSDRLDKLEEKQKMKQEIKTVELNKTNKKHLCVLRIARVSDGTLIYFKSKAMKELFEGYSGGMIRFNRWNDQTKMGSYDVGAFSSDLTFSGITSRSNDSSYIAENMRGALNNWGSNQLIINADYGANKGIPNLAFITSDKADKGIKVHFPLPLSNSAMTLYQSLADEYIKFLYENFCGGIELESTMRGRLEKGWKKVINGKFMTDVVASYGKYYNEEVVDYDQGEE